MGVSELIDETTMPEIMIVSIIKISIKKLMLMF